MLSNINYNIKRLITLKIDARSNIHYIIQIQNRLDMKPFETLYTFSDDVAVMLDRLWVAIEHELNENKK